jgi:glucose/arabinose dehydrogenase
MTLTPSSLHASRRLLPAALAIALIALAALAPRALSHPFHPGAEVADTSAPGLALKQVGTFAFPVYLTSPPGDTARQFVVEQSGQIRVIKNGQTVGRPFLDISGRVEFNQSERGLLSMAFAPDYATSRRFYVFYTERGGDLRVEEFRRSRESLDIAAPSTRRGVLEIEHSAYPNHNGGQLKYGAGGLYVSTGDGGGGGDPLRSGQNLNSLLGKILRIDPRRPTSRRGYSAPRSNPFVGRSGRNEIWHYGLRNPWRFSFDRATGDMSIGDVGQNAVEEVDFVSNGRRGANFGWNCFEGTLRYSGCSAPGHRPPVLQYAHDGGASCSVTGGYVLRDRAVPRLYGRYLYGDYCTGALHAATLREAGATSNASLSLIVPRLTSFGEDARGRLYMTSRSYGGRSGAVYRLRAATP